jgi:methionyl-tRNA formyltransferase
MNNSQTNIIFFGTSDFAGVIFNKLISEKYRLTVVTRPDQPVGRKKVLTPPVVKVLAEKNRISVLQPKKLDNAFNKQLSELNPDLFITAEYGKIIPQITLDIPAHGALNIHPSLLPAYRGPSPIQYALLNGETKTAVTIIKMDHKMDHGEIVVQKEFDINPNDTYKTLSAKLANSSASMLVKLIPEYLDNKVTLKPQDHTKATFTKIIDKKNGLVEKAMSANQIYNMYRAYTPWPGIHLADGTKLIDVEIKNNLLKINRLQIPGKKDMDAQNYINGYLKNNQTELFISSLF